MDSDDRLQMVSALSTRTLRGSTERETDKCVSSAPVERYVLKKKTFLIMGLATKDMNVHIVETVLLTKRQTLESTFL